MAAKKREKLRILQDRARISELLLVGYNITEITEILHRETGVELTRQQISYDINKIYKNYWRNEIMPSYTELVHKELARLDVLERELWRALRQTAEPDVTKEISKAVNEKSGKLDIRYIREVTKVGKASAAIFGRIIEVQQERRKVLGLYAPKETKKTVQVVKGYVNVSPSDWDDDDAIDGEYNEVKKLNA